ncbi:MAG: hypothetical protein ABIH11_00305 [Candidatus Altiarchaeota archaeon]
MVGFSATLFAVSVGVGIASGVMINLSTDHQWNEKGGILGGIVVGLLIALL